MKFFQYFKRESGPTKKEILRERFMNFVSELKVRGFSEQTIDAYLYHNGKFLDFNSGIEATAFVFPKITSSGGGVTQNPVGAIMYISPRLMRGMLSQIYILNDPLNNFPNFKLAHTEQNLIINDLNQQGMGLPDFVYYQGVQGPIKIWEIKYTGEEQMLEKYVDTDYSKYISWQL